MSTRDKGSLPADFDPAEYPILARHYGIEPSRPIGPVAIEIAAEHGITTGIERNVARYAAMAPKALDGLGRRLGHERPGDHQGSPSSTTSEF